MFVLKSVDFVDLLTVENTSHLTKEKSLMSVINLSYLVVFLIICVVLLKWNTNTIEKIVNIDKTQTNQMNSIYCCDCCSFSSCCEQTNRIVCSNTKSINFIFFDWLNCFILFVWNLKYQNKNIWDCDNLFDCFFVFVIEKFSEL
jgi:hypothetical protein